jgi:AbrB family looped-hinge helix DNA binding protein
MKVSESGQITIPREIRDRVGMKPGTEVEILPKDGEVIVRIIKPTANMEKFERALLRARGAADTGLTTDEIMAMTRGED